MKTLFQRLFSPAHPYFVGVQIALLVVAVIALEACKAHFLSDAITEDIVKHCFGGVLIAQLTQKNVDKLSNDLKNPAALIQDIPALIQDVAVVKDAAVKGVLGTEDQAMQQLTNIVEQVSANSQPQQ
jgi:hypothetical protein